MANQHTPGERRTVKRLVRLTPTEDARARDLARVYGCDVVDVLRAGLAAFNREHARVGVRKVDDDDGPAIQPAHDDDQREDGP